MSISFRHSAGFGKRMEYKLVGDMLMEGLDCCLPLVDDHGVDCVIKKSNGTFIEVQIMARSNEVTEGDAAGVSQKISGNQEGVASLMKCCFATFWNALLHKFANRIYFIVAKLLLHICQWQMFHLFKTASKPFGSSIETERFR